MELLKTCEMQTLLVIVLAVVFAPLLVRVRANIMMLFRTGFRRLFLNEEERKVIARTKKIDHLVHVVKQVSIYTAVVTTTAVLSYFVTNKLNERK
jgi:hypothetical protein